ncbi:MAG: haloacid dehalogenase-like hydrolase [Bacteroidetes bacterium]|nr:haloacid dehalogenase-like hydrolase [Bacteroidota bacterium]
MKMKIGFLPVLITGLLLVSCHCRDNKPSANDPLDRLNWSEKNFHVLNRLILDYGIGGKYYDKNKTPYAVFDWDQTCAHFDVEEALMRFQMFNLRYKMNREQFRGLLRDEIDGVKQLNDDFKNIRLANINQNLCDDYNFIYDNFSGMAGNKSLEEIRMSPQYRDFIARMLFLFEGYAATPGIGDEYALVWVIYLFTGFTADEVKLMSGEAVSSELANRIGEETLQSPPALKTRSGNVSCPHRTGLRVIPEIQDLFSALQSHGIEVFIVSASYKPVVEAFSGIGAYGYNLPPDHVIAMDLETGKDGRIIPEYKKGWVQTYKHGKVEAVNRKIKSGLGRNWDPLFTAGDSDGDVAMFTEFQGTKLSLIWNRVKGGEIGKLCRQAVDQMNDPMPRYILQGRNENTGLAIPCSESILLGAREPRLLLKQH